MVQQQRRSRKQRTETAIQYALERRWEPAAAENRALLDDFPDDLEAANRLGKALTELDDLDGAAEAYGRTLAIDQLNQIARRNLARIEELRAAGGPARKRPARRAPAAGKDAGTPRPAAVRPQALIEESGRSTEFTLLNPNAQALRRVAAGDPAELVPNARGVFVRSLTGATIGRIEARAGLRLRRMMEGGNTYAAVMRRVTEGEVTIYVREMHRDASLADQPSFLPPAAAAARRRAAPRAYTKSSILRHQAGIETGDDVEEEAERESWGPRPGRGDDEEEDLGDAGFGDSSVLGDEDADEPVLDDDDPIDLGTDEDE